MEKTENKNIKEDVYDRLCKVLKTVECPNGCGSDEFYVDCKSTQIWGAVLDRDGDAITDWKDSGLAQIIYYRIFCANDGCENDPYILEIK